MRWEICNFLPGDELSSAMSVSVESDLVFGVQVCVCVYEFNMIQSLYFNRHTISTRWNDNRRQEFVELLRRSRKLSPRAYKGICMKWTIVLSMLNRFPCFPLNLHCKYLTVIFNTLHMNWKLFQYSHRTTILRHKSVHHPPALLPWEIRSIHFLHHSFRSLPLNGFFFAKWKFAVESLPPK